MSRIDGLNLAKPAADAHERPARAEAGDEMRQASARLLDDLRRRRVVVRPPVARIVVPVRVEVAIRLGREHRLRFDNRAVGTLHRIGKEDLGSERVQDPLALGRHVLRHAQPDAIAARRADHRVGDAGVPGCRVKEHLVVRQRARSLAIGNHARSRPVLHRAAGIPPLSLGVQLDIPQPALEVGQADQGRISDQIDDRGGRSKRAGSGNGHIRLV